MARKKTDATSPEALTTREVVTSIKHAAKRKNIPAAGLEAQGRIEPGRSGTAVRRAE